MERVGLAISGLLLFYAGTAQDIVGFSILAVVVGLQISRLRAAKGASVAEET
jgi:hypothetical protein